MSVLVPGQDDLLRRACFAQHSLNLVDWFKAVEVEAWDYVQRRFPRPKEIFLVTGQTLTREYTISHVENLQEKCVVQVGADVGVPAMVDAGVFLGRGFEKVTPSTGFQITSPRENPCYHSIFLEVYPSSPISRLLGIDKKTIRLLASRFIRFR